MGEGGAEGPHRHDAARQRAAAGPCHARRVRCGSGGHDRSRRRHGSEPGRAGAPSAESHGIRQRRPRSHRSADRCRGAASRRRLERRIRQHGQRAWRLAGADAGLRLRGGEDQPSRGGRSDAQRRRHHLSAATWVVTGRASRGAAARHARRPAGAARVSARRRIRVQGRPGRRGVVRTATRRRRRRVRDHAERGAGAAARTERAAWWHPAQDSRRPADDRRRRRPPRQCAWR